MKRCMTILVVFLMAIFVAMPVAASADITFDDAEMAVTIMAPSDENRSKRIVDNADLLTYEEEVDLAATLDEYSEIYQFDMVVLTVDDMGGQDIISYADDYYDYNGYGYGSDYDGCILVLNMTTREWYISTCGYGITALNDAVIDSMAEEFVPLLSEGDYYKGFVHFADLCAYNLEGSLYGYEDDDTMTGIYPDEYLDSTYDEGYYEDASGTTGSSTAFVIPALLGMFGIALLIGFLIAFIPMFGLRKQLKSVTRKAAAADYVKPGSKRITRSRDAFLYSNVTRMPKPKENKSRGSGGGMSFGGGVHIGSSGRSHGGGGGRF